MLKPITEDDWLFFEKLHQSQEVMQYVSDPLSHEDIRSRFESRLTAWNRTSTHWLSLMIIEKSTGNKIGVTGIYPEWDPYQQAELGFLLTPEFQGKGFARESTLAMLDFAFNQGCFHKVRATVTEGNNASVGLLKSLGFIYEGTLRDNFKLSGKWHNDIVLGLLKDEHNVR